MFNCKECKKKLSYNEKHDAYYCKRCNIWNEKNCGFEKCCFCRDRPEKPLKPKVVKLNE